MTTTNDNRIPTAYAALQGVRVEIEQLIIELGLEHGDTPELQMALPYLSNAIGHLECVLNIDDH